MQTVCNTHNTSAFNISFFVTNLSMDVCEFDTAADGCEDPGI